MFDTLSSWMRWSHFNLSPHSNPFSYQSPFKPLHPNTPIIITNYSIPTIPNTSPSFPTAPSFISHSAHFHWPAIIIYY